MEVAVSVISALIALVSVVFAVAMGRRANEIATNSMLSADKSASAAEASAQSSQDLIDLQREQWNQARSAAIYIEGYSVTNAMVDDQSRPADMIFRFSNRGVASALGVRMTMHAKAGETWTQLLERQRPELGPGQDFRFEPKLEPVEYEHHSGFRVDFEYHDYCLHTDRFTFVKPKGWHPVDRVIATHDDQPHPSHPRYVP